MEDMSLLVLLNSLLNTVNGKKTEFNVGEKPLHLLCYEIQADGITNLKAKDVQKHLDRVKAAVNLLEKNIKVKLTLKKDK